MERRTTVWTLLLSLILCAVVALACVPAQAQTWEPTISGVFDGAGLAYLYPFSSAGSELDARVGAKLLPIAPPAKVELDKSLLQYVGANLTLDLLAPLDNPASLNGGLSLPVYSVESGLLSGRLGIAYVRGSGPAAAVIGTIGSRPTVSGLIDPGAAPAPWQWSVSPGGAFVSWTQALR